jgi:hypothetical protein
MIRQPAPQASVTEVRIFTRTIWRLGGHSTFGEAATSRITGGVVSTTVMVVEHEATLVPSVTPTASRLVPSGNDPERETLTEAPGELAGTRLVCTPVPFKNHTTTMASPSGSETCAVSCVSTPHSTTVAGGQVTVGTPLLLPA